MEQPKIELSVVDVYDIASEIREELEKIIETNGLESVTNLMTKVICALEYLENFAIQNEKENITIQNLKGTIAKLELEKMEKAEDQKKFEMELEQIEEHWRTETKDLISVLARLQNENKRLKSTISLHEHQEAKSADASEDVILQKLKTLIDNQREQIKNKEKELRVKLSELESLTCEVDKLSNTGKELSKKYAVVQKQVKLLVEERGDFLGKLQDQEREISILRENLGIAKKENEDLTKNSKEISNKTLYDLNDPNRTSFTSSELKRVLQERNELKAKISDLEDELKFYRPRKILLLERNSLIQKLQPSKSDHLGWKGLPRSGVHQFFRKLFNEGNDTFSRSCSKRSFSPLSEVDLSNYTIYSHEL